MTAIKLMSNTMKSVDIGRTFGDLGELIGGTPMSVYKAPRYLIIAAAEAEARGVRTNPVASRLAHEPVYGTAVVIGTNGESWTNISAEVIIQIRKLYQEEKRNVVEKDC